MGQRALGQGLLSVYHALLKAYGPQGWWPAEGPFEVMVGAVLTQNTAWRNVERALENLKTAGVLSPAGLGNLRQGELERLLRPAGTFRLKAARLRALLDYLDRAHGGDPAALAHGDTEELRRALLGVPGIGPETADSILLYAGGHATFVADAYTRRLLARLGTAVGLPGDLDPGTASYERVRGLISAHLPADPRLFNEFHALIVRHGKERCRRRSPRCGTCPLLGLCAYGQEVASGGGVDGDAAGG